ncbi:MAG TPA: phosphoglucomutase/phosphomannomutase family protein [Anaerolineae bacterium]|nr:phosphoglucomutase/phosphomannomutase family protein [Anaerolineae bacterium]
MTIHFGTDGWRAVIGEEFTFENVRAVAQAIAEYLQGKNPSSDAPIVIGFDTRFLSDRFAIAVSEVLAGNDLRVILSRADCPTPVASHAVRALNAQAGMMITASHNPPRYSGIKLKDASGASASSSETKRVEEKLRAGVTPHVREFSDALQAGIITRLNYFPLYLKHIQTLVDLQVIGSEQWRVVVDPMYGAGRGYLRSILVTAGCEVLEIRGEMNPGFGGIHPEPIEQFLAALVAAVRDHHSDIGLANDGDADRIGAVDDAGNFIDAHFIFALTLRYLLEVRKWRGAVVKTISTTQMINLLAAQYNLPLYETPVGFNHIADLMQTEDVLMGGEESGGITIRGHVPMGDGILMGLLLVEMMSYYKRGLRELVNDMRQGLGAFYYARNDLHTKPFSKGDLVRRLKENAPAAMAGLNLVSINDRDGVKYLFDDSSWLLIRPSGTEPILRVYSEARTPQLVQELLAQGVALSDAARIS